MQTECDALEKVLLYSLALFPAGWGQSQISSALPGADSMALSGCDRKDRGTNWPWGQAQPSPLHVPLHEKGTAHEQPELLYRALYIHFQGLTRNGGYSLSALHIWTGSLPRFRCKNYYNFGNPAALLKFQLNPATSRVEITQKCGFFNWCHTFLPLTYTWLKPTTKDIYILIFNLSLLKKNKRTWTFWTANISSSSELLQFAFTMLLTA